MRKLILPRSHLKQLLDRVLLGIKDRGITYTIEQTFKDLPDVFHGASVTVPEGTSMDELMKIEGVKVGFHRLYQHATRS